MTKSILDVQHRPLLDRGMVPFTLIILGSGRPQRKGVTLHRSGGSSVGPICARERNNTGTIQPTTPSVKGPLLSCRAIPQATNWHCSTGTMKIEGAA